MIVFFMLVSLLNCFYFYEQRWISDPAFFLLAAFMFSMYYQFALFFRQQWRLRAFRGPLAVPIIGNCYHPGMTLRSLLRHLAVLRKQYGKIFTLSIFSKTYLVVLDPVIARRVMSDNKTFVTDRDLSAAFSSIFGNRLLYSEVHTARERDVKNIVRRIFGREGVRRNMQVINRVAAAAVDDLIAEQLQWMHNFGQDAFTVRVDRVFALITLRVFMNVALHMDYRATPELERLACDEATLGGSLVQYMLCLTHLVPGVLLAPLRLLLRVWRDRHYTRIAARMQTQLEERQRLLLQTQTEAEAVEDRDDFLTAVSSGELSVAEVAEHMVALCGAGQDSSSYFASYACLLLARHPEVQTKLRLCIEAQMGDRDHVTAEDVAEMTYLRQVLQEVLRLYAVVPHALRKSKREVTIKDCSLSENKTNMPRAGSSSSSSNEGSEGSEVDSSGSHSRSSTNDITIPAGTNLLIPLYLMNRDPSVWPDPSAFRPERFQDRWGGQGQARCSRAPSHDAATEFSNARAGFYPFGYGNRTCLGAELVQTEAAVLLAHLLRRVVLAPDPSFQSALSAVTLLTPTHGVQVRMSVIRNESPLDSLLR